MKTNISYDQLQDAIDEIGMVKDYITAMTKLSPDLPLTPDEFLALFMPVNNALETIQNKLMSEI